MQPNGYQAEVMAGLRERIEALTKENSRLRAQCADKEFESSQLEKQLRRLERKIAAFDAKPSSTGLAKGFLTSEPPTSTWHRERRLKPKPDLAKLAGSGIIIDGLTGEQLDLKSEEKNLPAQAGASLELELMKVMQNPPEWNSEFDSQRYAQLLGEGRKAEAEALIQAEGGPSLNQMQQEPMEFLRTHPELDVNWHDPRMHGCSLLQWACSMGYENVASELLKRRADPTHRSAGVSCLAAALAHSWPGCAALLLGASADANEVADPQGKQTLLMWDGRDVESPLVSVLLGHHADVHLSDARGKTPLMHAATHGSALAVKALLAARADVDAQDDEGNTAFQLALQCYHGSIASLLLPLQKQNKAERENGKRSVRRLFADLQF
ncbi:unnamed protein product [Durusdinium trenchii]|uniref:Uncharacterized protein n=2 Tax=Durusdinium trenchii TaxID=1381693 RepID=A0ABP0MGM6_9DINO